MKTWIKLDPQDLNLIYCHNLLARKPKYNSNSMDITNLKFKLKVPIKYDFCISLIFLYVSYNTENEQTG